MAVWNLGFLAQIRVFVGHILIAHYTRTQQEQTVLALQSTITPIGNRSGGHQSARNRVCLAPPKRICGMFQSVPKQLPLLARTPEFCMELGP